MADPKGPETGQTGGYSARPKPATLDLPATEVGKPSAADAPKPDASQPVAATPAGPVKSEPAADPRKDAPKDAGPSSTASDKPAASVPPVGAKPTDAKSSDGKSSSDAKPSDTKTSDPKLAQPKPSTAKPVEPTRRGGPGYGAVLAAALGGAALAVIAVAVFGRALLPAPMADNSRVAAVETKLNNVSGDIGKLRSEIGQPAQSGEADATAKRLDEIGQTVTATGGRIDSVEAQVKEIAEKVAQPSVDPAAVAMLAGRVDGVDVRLRDVATTDAVTALQARVAGAETKADAAATAQQIAAIEARIASADDAVATAVAPLEQKIAALESALKARPVGDPAARLVVALGALEQAVEAGRPFPAELAAVKASSDNGELAALEPYAATGAPTRAALSSQLAAIIAGLPSEKPAADQGVFSRLVANAGGIVKVTPKDGPNAGSGDARSRLAALAASGDIEQALAALKSADEAVQSAAADWAKAATARISAEKALDGARGAALSRLAAID